jgi:hypothetical protein
MTNSPRCKSLAAILLLAGVCTILLVKSSAAQESRSPLPEMQKLSKLYVGRWEYTETYPKSPMAPNGGMNTGVYTSELGPGGNSIFNHFHSKGPVGEFDGTIVMTWDPFEKKYKAYFFSDSSPAVLIETGGWEDGALVYRVDVPTSGVRVVLRNVTKFLPDGKLTSEAFSMREQLAGEARRPRRRRQK